MFFLELLCFFYDTTDVGNLTSGSSTLSKSSLNIWKLLVHVLLKPSLENFEHYFASKWNECNYVVVCFILKILTLLDPPVLVCYLLILPQFWSSSTSACFSFKRPDIKSLNKYSSFACPPEMLMGLPRGSIFPYFCPVIILLPAGCFGFILGTSIPKKSFP